MIKKVITKKDLFDWIKLTERLYSKESLYVPPIYRVLEKELTEVVLKNQEYVALLCYQNKEIVGRILYTFELSKKTNTKTCYFSYFESINDYSVTKELFDYVINDMKNHSINILEGTYAPYDPDNKRGILVEGFELSPMIFTSYNRDYYGKLLEKYGLEKAYDTLALTADILTHNEKLKRLNDYVIRRNPDLHVEYLDFKNMEKQIRDIQVVMEKATTEMNYTMAPNIEMIKGFIKAYRFFINPDLITIMYNGSIPIGVCAILPDFNQLFKLLNGKLSLFKVFRYKKKIDAVRGFLQYVIPEYQAKGALICMYYASSLSMIKHKIKTFEASTILEENAKSYETFTHFDAHISKRYRIYRKVIK